MKNKISKEWREHYKNCKQCNKAVEDRYCGVKPQPVGLALWM